jgi:ECF sigma factor
MLREVYDELRKLARARPAREREPHQTLQPTALVHEAYPRVSGDDRDRLWIGDVRSRMSDRGSPIRDSG